MMGNFWRWKAFHYHIFRIIIALVMVKCESSWKKIMEITALFVYAMPCHLIFDWLHVTQALVKNYFWRKKNLPNIPRLKQKHYIEKQFPFFFSINFHIALAAPSNTNILLLNVNTYSHNNNRNDIREYETVFIIPGPNQDSNCKRTKWFPNYLFCVVWLFFGCFSWNVNICVLLWSCDRTPVWFDC